MKNRKKNDWMKGLAVTAALALVLGGCGGQQEELPETTEHVEQEAGESQPEAQETLHPVLTENRTSAYGADGTTLLCEGSWDEISVRDEGFAKLNEALEEYNSQKTARMEEELKELKEAAQSQLTDFPDTFHPYSTQDQIQVLRADQKVFSFQREVYSYAGGAHGNAGTQGYVYDSQAGTQLDLEDVVTDLDGFYSCLIQKLNESEYSGGLFDGWEETVRKEVYGEESEAEGVSYELQWTLAQDGIQICFSPYEIAPWAAGTIKITLPYDQAGLGIDEEWIPERKQSVWTLSAYQGVQLDVDKDGTGETVSFEPGETQGAEQMYTLTLDGQSLSFNGTYGVSGAYVMESQGGKEFFYADCRTDNDYHYLVIVDLEELKEKGAQAQVQQWTDGMYGDVPMDSSSFWLSSRGNLFSTFPIRRLFSLGEDGLPQTSQEEFTVDHWPVTTLQDVPGYTGEDFAQETVVPAGTRLFVTATDEKSRVTVQGEDGTVYQFEVDGQSWPHTIEGTDIEALFEGLVFAG